MSVGLQIGETLEILFGKGYKLEPVKPTKGQFLSTSRATVKGPKHTYENVAIMGPCREYNQFELALTDTRVIGIDAPIRMSGDIEGTPGVTVIGPCGSVTLDKGVIVAK
ncbi:MAG: propanediol utilization protein, partial [Lentisphaeria bacterium]|nr:propanediol utilization protein [Lentisphaeria bacterium]